MPCMNHSTKRRRRRQPSTAASSAWFLSLLPLAQAQHQQAQHASSSASPSTYLRKSRQRQLQSASTVSYLTFSPTDDATIYSSTTDFDTLHQLIFTAGKSSSPELNALLKFDLDFINHKSSSELNKAQLHLCNSFDAGGAFDPHVVDIYGVLPSYFSGGGDWSETAVTWQHSPQVDVSGGKAEFVESHKDDDCFWHTFSVTNLVGSTLDSSMMNDLTLRITSEQEYVSMYASKEFKQGKVAPRLDVYFGEGNIQQQSTEVTPALPATTSSLPTPEVSNGCSFNDKIVPDWSSNHIYDAADLVTNYNKVYECKPHPFSGWCNDYEPGVQSALPGSGGASIPWRDAWVEKADCKEMHLTGSKFTSTSSVYDSDSELCATPRYREGDIYAAQDQVLNQDAIYECKEPGWCGNGVYQPGQGFYWNMAWTLLHESLGCPDVPDVANVLVPTTHPTKAASASSTSSGIQCAPPFTVGHNYKFMELISFNHNNYACYIPDKCRQIMYAPRLGDVNVGVAWWKTDECVGTNTRHPTVLPTPRPTYPQREESVHSIVHDKFYSDAIPMNVAEILDKSKADIEQNVLVRRTPNLEWEASSIYHFEGLMKALGVMTLHNVRSGNFYLGEGMDDVEARYGLVNLAAFLAHSMAQSIKYDICDEPNWENVNGKYPLSNACGQGGQSYQDMTCPEDEKHMECPVKTTMTTRAITHANWGAEPGAPAPLFCQPKSVDGTPYTGFWDPKYKCDRPYRDPPEFCDAYEGQVAGRTDNSVSAANMAARIDVEGCCWWGRGVIPAQGVCSIGRLNYFLGKGAADAGRPSPYPKIDFCEDPEVICGSAQHSELKWVAGMTEWVDTVQSYDKDGYSYLEDLKRFVNGGMTYDTFIMNASKILQHGCHGDYTRCHAADGAWERMDNFKMIMKLFRLEAREEELATASSSSSTSSFSRPTPPTRPTRTHPPTIHPTPRPSSIVIVTPPPSPAPSPMPTVEPGSPTAKPTPRMPWYVNYDLRTCVNDGKQADWVDQSRLYGSKEVCCRKYFDYSEYKSDYLACISGGSASDSGRSESGDAQLNDQEPKEEAGVTLQVIGCPPSGWYSTPDCKSFFMCKNGRQFGEVMRCGEGLLFDKKSSSCLPDHIVKCDSLTSQSEPPPPPMQFGSHEYHSKTRPNT
ncbi:hypothetical protein QTG54_009762 [Skeletonema marinoi]|uniref:Chitin-binding type-2 domain-containing protein n=1 Tax=Skeletonema marinoi TaxID=267567 RepID=A0AAD8Y530_9STRA|nr:hypothetical protein QTG54_009762 [Skeletonema marinoi]